MVKQGKKQGAWVISVRSETAPDDHMQNLQKEIPTNEEQERVGGPAVDGISDEADPGK